MNSKEEPYYDARTIATVVGVSAQVVARLTGNTEMFLTAVQSEKRLATACIALPIPIRAGARSVGIGLDMKRNKVKLALCGFSKHADPDTWLYSQATGA